LLVGKLILGAPYREAPSPSARACAISVDETAHMRSDSGCQEAGASRWQQTYEQWH